MNLSLTVVVVPIVVITEVVVLLATTAIIIKPLSQISHPSLFYFRLLSEICMCFIFLREVIPYRL
jgi:hypothetical protein